MLLYKDINVTEGDIKAVAKTLYEYFDICGFTFSRHYRAHHRESFHLTTNIDQLYSAMENISSISVFEHLPEGISFTSFYEHIGFLGNQSMISKYEKQIKFQRDKYHILSEGTFIKWCDGYIDLLELGFSGESANTKLFRAIQNQDLIQHFMMYFTEQMSSVLDKAYQYRFKFSPKGALAGQPTETIDLNVNKLDFLNATKLAHYKGVLPSGAPFSLTRQEYMVAVYLRSGFVASKHIASALNLSHRTIESYIANLSHKLNSHDKTALIRILKSVKIVEV